MLEGDAEKVSRLGFCATLSSIKHQCIKPETILDTDIPTLRQLLEVLTVADCVWPGIPAQR